MSGRFDERTVRPARGGRNESWLPVRDGRAIPELPRSATSSRRVRQEGVLPGTPARSAAGGAGTRGRDHVAHSNTDAEDQPRTRSPGGSPGAGPGRRPDPMSMSRALAVQLAVSADAGPDEGRDGADGHQAFARWAHRRRRPRRRRRLPAHRGDDAPLPSGPPIHPTCADVDHLVRFCRERVGEFDEGRYLPRVRDRWKAWCTTTSTHRFRGPGQAVVRARAAAVNYPTCCSCPAATSGQGNPAVQPRQ